MRFRFSLLALAALLLPGLALGQAGTLDATFDGDGVVQTSVGTISGASRVAVQADGKLVLAGFTGLGASADFALVRYLASGTLDATFGGGDGIATADLNGADFVSALALQPDGKIVVAGYSDGAGTPDFTVARFTADGTLDATFGGGDGWMTVPFGAIQDEATDVLVRPTGEIVVVGFTLRDATPNDVDWALAQLTSTGALDAAFNGDGTQTIDVSGAQDYAFAAALQADGKLVVAGSAVTNGGASEPFAAARVNLDGTLDTSFDSDGVATLDVEGGAVAFAHTFDVLVRPTGEVIVAGAVWSTSGDPSGALAQFTATGAADATFGGGDGWMSYDVVTRDCAGAACEQANALTLQQDGVLLAAGFAAAADGTYSVVVARVLGDGTLDAAFDGDGLYTRDASGGVATDVQVQPDGRIVAAGSEADGFGALRLESGLTASTPQVSSVESVAGWRLVAPPVDGVSVGTLAGLNLVQGVSDEFPTGSPNLFTSYSGNPATGNGGYLVPASKSERLLPGRGAIWYFFTSGGPEPTDPRGTSRRAPLPVTLTASGVGPGVNVLTTFTATERAGATDGFYMLGNPFAQAFDLSGLSIDATSAASASLVDVMQLYDGASWVTRTRLAGNADGDASDDLAVWQGFFAEVTTNGTAGGPAYNPTAATPLTFTYDVAAAGTNPDFVGKQGSREELALVRFTLSGQLDGKPVVDRAASVLVHEAAMLGWDRYDATKLNPLTRSVALALDGERGGAVYRQAQRSLPRHLAGPLEVPLHLSVPAPLHLTLAWSGLETLPSGWTVTLLDRANATEAALSAGASYGFEAAPRDSARFALRITPARTTGVDAGVATKGLHLLPISPNPFGSTTAVRFVTSEAGAVRVSVYDMLGRRVALLHEGPVAQDAVQRVLLDGATLPVGVYVVRVEQNGHVQTAPLVRAQ